MEAYVVWIPIFIVLFVILPQQDAAKRIATIREKQKERATMTNEIIQKFIGKTCYISNGTLGERVVGKLTEINANWIEVETKKGTVLLNLDYVQNIKEKI